MFELKPLSKNAIPTALEKANRYRLLNEPWEAESICRDILLTDPESQDALVVLILAITDQFEEQLSGSYRKANELLPELLTEYDKLYYAGIVNERQGNAILKRGLPRSQDVAYGWIRKAMAFFEQAAELASKDNQDAVLRWNTCIRTIEEHRLAPRAEEEDILMLE